ncbi:hypothetical protein EDEG_01221 [Edhazardia aedis USNM 41457]|uniref:Uncharacterized protein n=1 Tax=Edhazardia aedis (strain USNM 41457) TaxID=1003232 RepID=J9DTH8_EDHAE|nr:hypothetical protein EDEG_01221 [Edhazardia aedis USNM 41457]|eukprot:EJW04572.1 hypothetical protein EDEG_01221 [Edhazardia aedis USNM 41457]
MYRSFKLFSEKGINYEIHKIEIDFILNFDDRTFCTEFVLVEVFNSKEMLFEQNLGSTIDFEINGDLNKENIVFELKNHFKRIIEASCVFCNLLLLLKLGVCWIKINEKIKKTNKKKLYKICRFCSNLNEKARKLIFKEIYAINELFKYKNLVKSPEKFFLLKKHFNKAYLSEIDISLPFVHELILNQLIDKYDFFYIIEDVFCINKFTYNAQIYLFLLAFKCCNSIYGNKRMAFFYLFRLLLNVKDNDNLDFRKIFKDVFLSLYNEQTPHNWKEKIRSAVNILEKHDLKIFGSKMLPKVIISKNIDNEISRSIIKSILKSNDENYEFESNHDESHYNYFDLDTNTTRIEKYFEIYTKSVINTFLSRNKVSEKLSAKLLKQNMFNSFKFYFSSPYSIVNENNFVDGVYVPKNKNTIYTTNFLVITLESLFKGTLQYINTLNEHTQINEKIHIYKDIEKGTNKLTIPIRENAILNFATIKIESFTFDLDLKNIRCLYIEKEFDLFLIKKQNDISLFDTNIIEFHFFLYKKDKSKIEKFNLHIDCDQTVSFSPQIKNDLVIISGLVNLPQENNILISFNLTKGFKRHINLDYKVKYIK